MARHYEVTVKSSVEPSQKDSFMTGRDKWIVFDY